MTIKFYLKFASVAIEADLDTASYDTVSKPFIDEAARWFFKKKGRSGN